jgi:hypothetical protein
LFQTEAGKFEIEALFASPGKSERRIGFIRKNPE